MDFFFKNGRFSGRIRPDWGNTARADMAGLGSIGLNNIILQSISDVICYTLGPYILSEVCICSYTPNPALSACVVFLPIRPYPPGKMAVFPKFSNFFQNSNIQKV